VPGSAWWLWDSNPEDTAGCSSSEGRCPHTTRRWTGLVAVTKRGGGINISGMMMMMVKKSRRRRRISSSSANNTLIQLDTPHTKHHTL